MALGAVRGVWVSGHWGPAGSVGTHRLAGLRQH